MADSLTISLEKSPAVFAPLELLVGRAQWRLERVPAEGAIHLLWHTVGRGTEDIGIVASEVVSAPQTQGERQFQFQLPRAPYSFSGKLISLIWSVELAFESASGDPALYERVDFVLSPSGAEIILKSKTQAPA